MRPDPATCAAAFLVAAVVTGIVARLARRSGALDAPDPARRIHTVPTPRLGGVGIAVGVAAGWGVGTRGVSEILVPILVGCVLFFLLGLADDLGRGRRGLPAWAKWLAQTAAAGIAVALGLRWHGSPGIWHPTGESAGVWPSLDVFGALTPVMTVVWILAVVNVINFLDGIDGIVAVTATVCLGTAAVSHGLMPSHLYAAGAAAVVGFAVWNLPRARIFMGDGGSHLIGFLIATETCGLAGPLWQHFSEMEPAGGIEWSYSVPWPLVSAPLLPAILDVFEALVHKARHRIPMSQAHADHLYQRLVKAGWPAWAVALRYGLLSLAGVLLAGPVAERYGLAAAIVPGVALLVVHWVTGVRATRNVPRLERT